MKDEGAEASPPDRAFEDELLMNQLADMLAQENTPPPLVMELARQSYGLRAVDAELAALTADSDAGSAAAVRHTRQGTAPRLLTFATSTLVVEMEVSGLGRQRRIFGELIPRGLATIEVRQPGIESPLFVDADDDGRFVIENPLTGPLSLICHRLGHKPVTTEWMSVD